MKRLLVVLTVAAGAFVAGALFAGDASASEAADRAAQIRADIQAKIGCAAAQSCGTSAEVASTSSHAPRVAEVASIRTPRAPRTPSLGAAAAPAPAPAPAAQQAAPQPQADAPYGHGKVIEISISEQKLRAWEGGRVVLETAVSTGKPGHETPRGEFSILSKERNHWSTQYHVDMPYAMRVVRGIYIHEIPISPDGRRIGASDIGRPVSAGCIRVPEGTAKRLYDWAEVGTRVIIH